MTETILEQQLLGLPPRVKVAVGGVLAIGGGVASVVLWGMGWVVGASIFALAMGMALVLSGRSECARIRAHDAEVERARSEWSELERGAEDALRQGESVVRYLQARGYREFAVRRWIAAELKVDARRARLEFESAGAPFSVDQLRLLFERLDRASATGYECDHQFTLTRRFFEEQRLPADSSLRWMGEHGAGCDCEVILNVEQQWGARVGFAPRADKTSGRQFRGSTSVPDRIPIVRDDYHASCIGRLSDGRLFLGTQPFVAAASGDPGCEYLAVYLFHPDGTFAEARIDTLGPRGSLDAAQAQEQFDRRIAELGEIRFESIAIAPFRVDRDGVTFGLIPRAPEDEDDHWWAILVPGDYMAFTDPWDGYYDT